MEPLDRLRAEGCAMLNLLTRKQIAETNAFLAEQPVFMNAHVPQTARNRGEGMVPRKVADGCECICVHTTAAIMAPHLFERGLETIHIAAEYLGRFPPVAYSMNAFWTRPGPAGTRPDIQEFHTDADDKRFLPVFFYLTDVLKDEDGPQEIINARGNVCKIFGRAGTVFLSDTSRMHRGLKPTSRERGIAWFRWGVSDHPPANVWDKIQPIARTMLGQRRYPSDPRLQEAVKLLVE